MSHIAVHQNKAVDYQSLLALCPFGAIVVDNGHIAVTSACRMCKLCIKHDTLGVFELVEDDVAGVDTSEWNGIAVFIEIYETKIHPVSLEMIGKAQELAGKIGHSVYAAAAGEEIRTAHVEELLHYGVDELYLYEAPELKHFRIEPYTAVFEDFIVRRRPSVVLVGGTSIGRVLAPRIAARFRTGLTADCTILDIQENTDLDQIRPAFGGNIMAHIRTTKHRPQFATVRYKIFNMPERIPNPTGTVIHCTLPPAKLKSTIEILKVHHKEKVKHLEEADVIVAAGRGIGSRENLKYIEYLAELLDGEVAGTRTLIEAGWIDPRRQIGLSGRTVRPRLIITCGISGSVQFTAGMNGSEKIIAINIDPKAAIFSIAHIGIVGDVTKVIPELIDNIKAAVKADAEADVSTDAEAEGTADVTAERSPS
jgi:electron transfer flavoprotein alpha subunit